MYTYISISTPKDTIILTQGLKSRSTEHIRCHDPYRKIRTNHDCYYYYDIFNDISYLLNSVPISLNTVVTIDVSIAAKKEPMQRLFHHNE